MTPSGDNNGSRVTMRTLDDKLALVRQEQKTEHVKTRAFVGLAIATNLVRAIPWVLGYFWWHPW
jgi:hypothetical protein